ncbi:MAG: YraN family protein [Clostridia bacterium]|nr:YraN family protein [Clostridia bacterium]
MDRKKELGNFGEQAAALSYEKDGYSVVQTNYRQRFGEIDVIAQGRGCIVFCEVKLRSEKSMVSPAQAVDIYKQRKIIMTAQAWLCAHNTPLQPRFDVVQIIHRSGEILSLERIENAFGV